MRHLAAENDIVVRTYIVPEGGTYAADGRDFVHVSVPSDYDAVIMERGWNDPRDLERFPVAEARSYVDSGGVLTVLDVDRDAAARQAVTLAEASEIFGALPELRNGRVQYLHDVGAREASGSDRFFVREMQYFADWLGPAYETIESLFVASPVLLAGGDFAACGHATTHVLVDDQFVDTPPLTPWAAVNTRGHGVAILVAAAFSADPLIDGCPDNARWLSAVLRATHGRVLENRQRSSTPVLAPRQDASASEDAIEVHRLLTSDEGRHLERKSSFLTTRPGG